MANTDESEEPDKNKDSRAIPDGIWLYFRRGFTFGQLGRAHPYVWSAQERKPKTRNDSLLWLLSIIVTYVYTIFVVVRCIQKNLDPTVPLGMKIYLRLTVVYYSFPLIFHTSLLVQRSDGLSLAIEAIKFMKWIEDNVDVGGKSLLKKCHFFMIYIFYGFNCISGFVVLFAFLKPDSPEMISSVLTNPSLMTKILCGMFQGYIEYTFHSQGFLIIFLFFGCLFASWALLLEMRTWIKPNLGKKAHKFIILYDSIQFMTQMASDVFLSFMYPVAIYMIIGLIIFCAYSAARLEGFIALSLGFMGLIQAIFVVVLLSTFAEVYELSMNIKKDLRKMCYCDRKQKLEKRLCCLAPIKFKMRNSYYVDKVHVLTVINFILQSSISFLIANGST